VSVTASAPAKINLVLSVGPLREDGYHELATMFHAIDRRDTVTVESGPSGSGVTLSVEGEGADGVPLDDTNLAARAAMLLAERTGRVADVRIHINKTIPVAGGLAGGSADAAAALVACDALWGTRMTRTRLTELAAELGSDVPFSVHGGTMIGRGRGEDLTPVLAHAELTWVIWPNSLGLSTPTVYAECDRLRGDRLIPSPSIDEAVVSALRADDPRLLGPLLSNDLQEAAISLRPELADVLAEGDGMGAIAGIVSGSGPTTVFLTENEAEAKIMSVKLGIFYPDSPAFVARGPAPGARLED